ncbi:Cardiolipin synthase N-terminal [Trema orientale]|uniref:Cardiolipin synthase N-terminal n=1 Tax=Trema orientale TaxID=63057 RepID=A0A2P5ER12_TREOI|nr:Cardiolipin synthase N-terminal [Trema orientale]
MLANASLISCNFSNFPSLTLKSPDTRNLLHLQAQNLRPRIPFPETRTGFSILFRTQHHKTFIFPFQQTGLSQICHSTLNGPDPEDPVLKDGDSLESKVGESGNVADGRDWTTSILLSVLWGALLYYVFNLAPNQTPTRDMYFLKKLLNLKGDDGFRMNDVLVSLWYIMGLWPLVYSKLLIPTGRSSKSNVVVWPFVVLSFFGGAYALLPYFVLWKPPPPPVEETELSRWPLNFLESKLTAGVSLAAGLGIITYAGLANGDDWKEFFQYFRESRFIHATCLDFTLLSAFAPFWVYNDMTARKWFDKGSWLLPLSLVPFLGPALYIILRPPLSPLPAKLCSTTSEPDNT